VSVFPKTRAAGYIAGTGPGELARARAPILLARLGACEDLLPGGEGDVPAALHGLMRDLVLAVRDLAGPAWLDARGDDPDVTAFTVLEATAGPPDRARIDEICSRLLWARFAPDTDRDDPAPAEKLIHAGRSRCTGGAYVVRDSSRRDAHVTGTLWHGDGPCCCDWPTSV
jgi:hypothetical protein